MLFYILQCYCNYFRNYYYLQNRNDQCVCDGAFAKVNVLVTTLDQGLRHVSHQVFHEQQCEQYDSLLNLFVRLRSESIVMWNMSRELRGKRKRLPTTGIEPATTGLRVLCSTS
ncbi:Hypothetical_protein [Hexamita inflata]|uniref:Hypothetical_protein n=1 Tax=Hexamita inflata TaxID=28002 RepID=A0AA86USH0_9EUKA|nr:Hypothetical protein HINF_LOCUS57630 [Hexamita inflata]